MDLAYYIEGSTSNERLAALKRRSAQKQRRRFPEGRFRDPF
jgi:hypothetical protein